MKINNYLEGGSLLLPFIILMKSMSSFSSSSVITSPPFHVVFQLKRVSCLAFKVGRFLPRKRLQKRYDTT